MCACYEDVMKRLKDERKRLHWSQDDMSRYVHINQGNYCKIEKGNRRFSYYEIKELYKSAFDVNYIFSGQRSNEYYKEMIGDCSYKEALALFSVISSVIAYCWAMKRTSFWKSMYQKVKFMHLIDIEHIEQQNLFLLVRHELKCLQIQMAKLLEVDVKKLRDLEKGKCLPDSELLWLMYERFLIPPAVILKSEKGLICEMSCLLEQLDSAGEKTPIDVIKNLRNIY